MLQTRYLTGGTTHTIAEFWNSTATAFFRAPAGAIIRVKYGKGRYTSSNRQQQTLDGETIKALRVGKGSLVYARMRVKLPEDGEITYDMYPGEVAQLTPEDWGRF
jgi:hypothetical protein